MFYCVYLTTNLINKKQYVGDHSTDNLNDSYLGSGVILGRAFKKHGKNNFKREILDDSFKTKQEAFDAQAGYIIKYNTLNPNGYNISPKGGMQTSGGCSEETRLKISNSKKGCKVSEEQKLLLSKILSGRKKPPRTKEHTEKIIKNREKNGWVTWNKGLTLDDERVKKYAKSSGNSRKGKPSNMSGKKHKPESIEKLKKTLLEKKLKKLKDENKG